MTLNSLKSDVRVLVTCGGMYRPSGGAQNFVDSPRVHGVPKVTVLADGPEAGLRGSRRGGGQDAALPLRYFWRNMRIVVLFGRMKVEESAEPTTSGPFECISSMKVERWD